MKEKKNKRNHNKLFIIIIFLTILILVSETKKLQDLKKKGEELEVFSEITEENKNIEINSPKKEIDSNITDWNLILVNKDNPIPENYEVQTEKIEQRWETDIRITKAAEQMLNDARKEGLDPIICSAYRTSDYQKNLFNNKVKEYKIKGYSPKKAEEQAALWVTIPGTSEHELGLSLDIVGKSYQILDEKQENTDVQKWLIKHCHEYGFILRYPTEKKDITKINYEPWHYRYVGIKDAKFIKEKGFCLEEYIEYLKE